jgi:hypothetical protein
VRIELLLDHSLRPRLLAGGLMLRLKLHPAELTDSDDRNILDSLHDPQIALGHEHSLPQFANLTNPSEPYHSTHPLGIITMSAFAHSGGANAIST